MFKNGPKLLLTGQVEVRKVEEGVSNIFNKKWKIKHHMFKRIRIIKWKIKHLAFKNVLKLLSTGQVEVRKVEEGGSDICTQPPPSRLTNIRLRNPFGGKHKT